MKRIKIFPRDLENRTDYTIEESIRAFKNQLQLTEKEQNLLDGGKSAYRYSDKDVKLLTADGTEGEPFLKRKWGH